MRLFLSFSLLVVLVGMGCKIPQPEPLLSFETTLFPNPTTGQATVRTPKSTGTTTIEVFDPQGNPLNGTAMQEEGNYYMQEIDLTGQPRGQYPVYITTTGAETTQLILIRQ